MSIVYYLIGVVGGALGVAVDPWFGMASALVGFTVEQFVRKPA